jgi:hypothetical protein
MKESDLYIPVRDWLRARGFTVHIEIFDCDVVGINADGKMVAVELKTGMTLGLYNQLSLRATWADEVWAAVPATAEKPKHGFAYNGYGLLIVSGGRVKVQRIARPQPWNRCRSQIYRRKELSSRLAALDHHVAGLPSCPQAREQRNAVRLGQHGLQIQ